SSRPSRISDSSSTTRMEPLDMDRFLNRGELDVEGSAFARGRAHVNLSGMLLNDSVAHGETEARAATAGFRGEERIEDAVNVFARNAGASVRNFNFDAAVVCGSTDFK